MQDERTNQNIILEGRKKISISGVVDVDSFDDNSVNLITNLGILLIKGNDLKIEKLNLDTGEITATGDFYLIEYTADEQSKGGGLFTRLFR